MALIYSRQMALHKFNSNSVKYTNIFISKTDRVTYMWTRNITVL